MHASTRRWRDRRKYLWLCGLIVPMSPFLAWFLVDTFGPGVFWATGVFVMAILVPAIDLIRGVDHSSPPMSVLDDLEEDRYYRWCTYLFLPLQYAGLIAAGYLWTHAPMGIPEKFAFAMTVGVVGGVGINAAHELGHKRSSHERWLAKFALAQSFYGHFYVEHVHGHHIRVATPDDPASARYGESLWAFMPRSVWGSLRSGWRHERNRLRRRGQFAYGLRNDIINSWLITVVLWSALILIFGVGIAPWLVVQAIVGIMMLESANYIEHYGLLRERRPNGTYVKVEPKHSWNSDHVWSNLFLYQLQRHSDHHTNPLRRYQALQSQLDAPQLPAGYASMTLLAAVPPLFRRVIHPRLLAHYEDDLNRVNAPFAPPRRGPVASTGEFRSVRHGDRIRWVPVDSPRGESPTYVRDHLPSGRWQIHDDRGPRPPRADDQRSGRHSRQSGPPVHRVRLDGNGEGPRHLRQFDGPPVQLHGRGWQPRHSERHQPR